ncbi:MAG: ABC transporter permease [Gemmatimonadaceae bacterium]
MNLLNDVRFALRTLRKQRSFAVTAVATMALAIGASTAIFSVVESTVLRPLPFQTPDRLVFLWGVAGPERAIRGASFIEARDWERLNRAFEHVAIYDETSLNLVTEGGADRIEAEMVSWSYFPMLGASAQVGRTFTAAEDTDPNAQPVVTISDGMWRGRFGGDPGIVGRSITLNDRSFTVLGVMAPGFAGISFDTDVWFPAAMVQANGGPSNLDNRGTRWLGAVGRLNSGVTLAQAQIDADRVAAQLSKDFPESNTDRGILLQTLRDSYLGTTRDLLRAVFAAVGLLLLIACANVVGLQLVRAASRGREIALRIAVGADRSRLVQQLVVEGLVLAGISAIAGLAVGHWVLAGLIALAPEGALPNYAAPAINLPTLGFAIAIALGSGLVFGLLPALRSTRLDLAASLKEGTRSSASGFGRARFSAQHALVVGETALALVLLVGAGLYVRSLQRQLAVDPGFDPRNVLRARVTLPQQLTPDMRLQAAEQLQARLAALPSVRGVAIGSDVPLGGSSSAAFIHIPEGDHRVRFYRHSVTPDFFSALGIPLVSGRAFTEADRPESPAVVTINESMARRFWSAESPIGKRIRLGDASGPEVTIVGVVADARYRDLTTPLLSTEPDVYFPLAQRPSGSLQVAVRADIAPENLAGAIRRELAAVAPNTPLFGVRRMEDMLAQQTANGRFASSVLAVFGGAALILTAVGLYGVLAFLVTLRSREIGIRIALGATRRRVLANIVSQGMTLVIPGLAIGILVAFAVTKLISSQLFGIGARDPLVFASVALLLLSVALVASWLPARRAAGIDPQVALRSE